MVDNALHVQSGVTILTDGNFSEGRLYCMAQVYCFTFRW